MAGHPGAGARLNAPPPLAVERRSGWAVLQRVALWIFIALVALLLASQARRIHWHAVLASVLAIPPPALLGAALLAACSHLLYSCYDLLGRHMTGHRLSTREVMGVTFISYAFNLNLGSLVGGIAFRYRLYSRLGLDKITITRVLGFSMLTNWFGYLVLAGLLFFFWPLALPPDWRIDSGGLRILGAVLMLAGAAYLLLCAVAGEHRWNFRGHELETPSLRMALLQLLISSLNWSLMGAVIWLLLQGQLPYAQVLQVFLVAAVAGVITHVPGGLGVLEAVFIALLSHRLSTDALLGALLAYRALYYLLPLALALVAYGATELRLATARRRQQHALR